MIIAKKKRIENIVEYLIYMFQVEDSIRACNFKPEKIDDTLVKQYKVSENEKNEIRIWYNDLAGLMKSEGKEETGHVQPVLNQIKELDSLHLWLLKQPEMIGYKKTYNQARTFLLEYQQKIKSSFQTEVEIALNSVYSYILSRYKNKEIEDQTKMALNTISAWLVELARNFKRYEKGEFEVD